MKIKEKKFPIKRKLHKHRMMKRLFLVSFFAGIVYNSMPGKKFLPYNDSQNIGSSSYNSNNDLNLAMQAYDHLLNMLYEKCQNMGVNIEGDYLIKIVAYDTMSNAIDVILQKGTQSLHMKFSAINLEEKSINMTGSMEDQISQLVNILNAPLIEIPVFTTLSASLKATLQSATGGVQNYSVTNVQFSDGNTRSENEEYGLIAGRDYKYFNVYGKGTKDGKLYDTLTSVAMNVDDMEVQQIEDLVGYYVTSPNDPKIVVNLTYQEKLNTLEMLNQNKTSYGLEY